jgi:2'-5' RNA ligase
MNGIASLLDPSANSRVGHIWDELGSLCGLHGVKITPFPHFTWQVTEGYELPLLESILDEFSRRTQPFIIRTDGLGVFTGENPVIYISIFKDEKLMKLHSMLWEQTKGYAKQPDMLYSPARWIPHITLAYNDLTNENVGCAFRSLVFQSFNWEINIDNLIFITQTGDQTAETGKYQLGS